MNKRQVHKATVDVARDKSIYLHWPVVIITWSEVAHQIFLLW